MDPFVGEIRVFGFSFAPRGWAFCAGQLMPISQNTALYALLGTQFGGDGRTTFGLPNLQSNVAINQGQGPGLSPYYVGSTAGANAVTLTLDQMASHNHTLNASTSNGAGLTANGNVLATSLKPAPRGGGVSISGQIYSSNASSATTALDQRSIVPSGGGQPHNNMQPSLVFNYCIALQGIYPQRQ